VRLGRRVGEASEEGHFSPLDVQHLLSCRDALLYECVTGGCTTSLTNARKLSTVLSGEPSSHQPGRDKPDIAPSGEDGKQLANIPALIGTCLAERLSNSDLDCWRRPVGSVIECEGIEPSCSEDILER
jgi:hypothetical protein